MCSQHLHAYHKKHARFFSYQNPIHYIVKELYQYQIVWAIKNATPIVPGYL